MAAYLMTRKVIKMQLCKRNFTVEKFQLQGGACGTSFYPENLRQQQAKNKAALGTTALPEQGARRRKKKPSARAASHDQLVERSFKQKGQKPAATQLRDSFGED